MGQEDIVMERYISENSRFADLFNGSLFGGRQEICARDLSEASPVYTVKDAGGRWRKPSRDVRKFLKNGGALQVLAVENQSYVDYLMPLRCMEYATAEYRSQAEKIQAKYRRQTENRTDSDGQVKTLDADEWLSGLSAGDRLAPVITIVLYWGREPWKGPRDLKDIMDFRGNKALETKFCNYPMHLICINEEKDCTQYRTDLREMFEILSLRNDRKALRGYLRQNSALRGMAKDAEELLTVVLGERILKQKKETAEKAGKEENSVKSLIEEIMEDEREEGREEGREKGYIEGWLLHLVQQVCKKLVRARTPQQISEDLEEDLSFISQICEAAKEFAPNYEYEKVFEKVNASV